MSYMVTQALPSITPRAHTCTRAHTHKHSLTKWIVGSVINAKSGVCVYSMQMCVHSFPEWATTSSSTAKKRQRNQQTIVCASTRNTAMDMWKKMTEATENRTWFWVSFEQKCTTKFCWTSFCVIYATENLNSSVSCLFVCICLRSDPWRNKSFWVNQWNFSLLALLPTSWSLLCMRMGG